MTPAHDFFPSTLSIVPSQLISSALARELGWRFYKFRE